MSALPNPFARDPFAFPQQAFRPSRAPVAMMPEPPPLEVKAPDNWGAVNQFLDLFKEEEEPDDKLQEVDRLLARLAVLQTPAAEAPAPGAARPSRTYSPLEAPDTGEVDTGDIPAGYFAKNKAFESAGRSNARNPITGASGIYQFLPSTWRGLMKDAPHLNLTEEGITSDDQQDRAMRYFTAQNKAVLKPLLGRTPTGGELYSAHLLGAGGASSLLGNLDKPLRTILPAPVISANPWLRNYATGRDLLADLDRKFG